MNIVPATVELLRAFYGDRELPTTYALVVLDGDAPIAVVGLTRNPDGSMLLYSDSPRHQHKDYPVLVMKIAKRVIKLADERGWRLSAHADESVEGSQRFLEHLGFEKTEDGEYIRWAH